MLKRPGAEDDYTDIKKGSQAFFDSMTGVEKELLYRNVLLGLPGSKDRLTGGTNSDGFENIRRDRQEITKETFNLFFTGVAPVAEELNLNLAIHPDSAFPPYPVLGLPRIVCTEQDVEGCFYLCHLRPMDYVFVRVPSVCGPTMI